MLRSFFFAGYECATGYNKDGEWIDQIAATHHDRYVDEDYHRLSEVGIHAVREGIRWPCVDWCGRLDYSSVKPFVKAAAKHRMDIIWDLFHYGYPGDLDIFSDEFHKRFADYCHATAKFILRHQSGPYYFTPVNEPSFFSWAAGDVARFAPHCEGRAKELKVALIRAAIQGVNAIRAVIPEARMVNVDPVCRVVVPADRPELAAETERYNCCDVFESWDMLCGMAMPELGGSREHLDIVGMNYYWTNQWELGRDERPLAPHDPRLSPLRDLVRGVWERYGGDLLITETAHVSDMRSPWLEYVAEEAQAILSEGIPLRGICLYPILGMPEWHFRDQWTHMGLWDLEHHTPRLDRKVHEPMLETLKRAQKTLRSKELVTDAAVPCG